MLVRAREDDAERIAGLHIASWHATYKSELSEALLQHQDHAARAAEWRHLLAEGVAALLAMEGEGVAGFVACGPARGAHRNTAEWEIYNLHVAPLRHGEGLGSQLFGAAVKLGQECCARELVLWVVRTNRVAREFYERKGMRCDGGEQDHAVTTTKRLAEVRYRRGLNLPRMSVPAAQ